MLMLCIIFDKRDAVVDKIRGLHSLATDITADKLSTIIIIVQTVYFMSCVYLLDEGATFPNVFGLVISGAVLQLVYQLSKRKQGYLFYYFVVDGLMFFSALLTTLTSI